MTLYFAFVENLREGVRAQVHNWEGYELQPGNLHYLVIIFLSSVLTVSLIFVKIETSVLKLWICH